MRRKATDVCDASASANDRANVYVMSMSMQMNPVAQRVLIYFFFPEKIKNQHPCHG